MAFATELFPEPELPLTTISRVCPEPHSMREIVNGRTADTG
jgi:hypothetical protein